MKTHNVHMILINIGQSICLKLCESITVLTAYIQSSVEVSSPLGKFCAERISWSLIASSNMR